jgi:hypothetical protein
MKLTINLSLQSKQPLSILDWISAKEVDIAFRWQALKAFAFPGLANYTKVKPLTVGTLTVSNTEITMLPEDLNNLVLPNGIEIIQVNETQEIKLDYYFLDITQVLQFIQSCFHFDIEDGTLILIPPSSQEIWDWIKANFGGDV